MRAGPLSFVTVARSRAAHQVVSSASVIALIVISGTFRLACRCIALVAISQMTVSQMDALSTSESHHQRFH